MASRPVPASMQANPWASSRRTSERRTSGSSSTTRHCAAPMGSGAETANVMRLPWQTEPTSRDCRAVMLLFLRADGASKRTCNGRKKAAECKQEGHSEQLRNPRHTHGAGPEVRNFPPRPAGGRGAAGEPAALLPSHPAREPAAHRGRCQRRGRGHRRPRALGAGAGHRPGDRLHARPRAAPGLHRRARHRGPRRHARRDGAPRR